jgi:hypothetical protein
MDNYYVSKLLPLMAEAGVHAIANPLINITLQGRHDSYPKRRGMTRVPELLAAGINVGFGHDCVMDPWYSLGSGDMLEVAAMGLHVAQMTSQAHAPVLRRGDGEQREASSASPIRHRARLPRRLRAAAGTRPHRGHPPAGPRLMVVRRGQVMARTPPAAASLAAARPTGAGGLAFAPGGPHKGGCFARMNLEGTGRRQNHSMMKLIGSLTSPYVRKVRVVMAEKKLDFQFVLEDVWGSDAILKPANPLGKVPCLVMEGGEAVFDSRVIVEYLDTCRRWAS